MATASNRDVRLGFEIDVSNPEAVKRLADDVGRLADEGGAAAPEFKRLADDLDRLAAEAASLQALRVAADDVERLGAAQAEARSKAQGLAEELKAQAAATGALRTQYDGLRTTQAAATRQLAETTTALRLLKAGIDESGRSIQRNEQAEREALATQQRLRNEIAGRRETLANLLPQLRENEQAEARLTRRHEVSVKALDAAERALGQARGGYSQAAAGAEQLGLALDDLARSQSRVADQTQAALGQARLQQQLRQADADAARQAALEVEALAETQRRGAAAVQSELAALKDSEKFTQQYAAAKQRAAQEALDFVLALDREEAQLLATSAAAEKKRRAELDALAATNKARADYQRDLEAMFAAQDKVEQGAREMAAALKAAFGTAGLRSLQDIATETQRVDAAVALLNQEFRQGAISAADFNRAVAGAKVRLEQLRAEAANIPALPSAFERLNSTINTTIGRFGSLTAAVATVGVAVRPIIEAEVALQSVTRVLTQVTGSSEGAARQIQFLRDEAQRSGISFDQTAQAYAKFASSALQAGQSVETTQRAFAAVANATGNLGLSSEQAKRALEALSQIASKGTVSMEELRQQLGDALPGVFPLLAKELGITTRELGKLVESGELLAQETIPFIVSAIEKLGSEGRVTGLVAEWNRFKNVLSETATIIVDGPLGQAAGLVLKAVAGVTRDLSMAATVASEGFKLLGIGVLSTLDLLRGNLDAFDAYGLAVEDSSKRVKEFADRAYESGDAIKRQASELASSIGMTEQQAQSFAKLLLSQKEQADAADAAVLLAKKNKEAREAEARAIEAVAKASGDELVIKRAAAQAAAIEAEAAQEVARAREAEAAVARENLAQREASISATQRETEETQKFLEKAREGVAAKEAEAEASRQMAVAADESAKAARLAAETYGDQSAEIESLSRAVEAAEQNLALVERAFRNGTKSAADLREATTQLRDAKVKLRDAADDLAKAIDRSVNALKAETEFNKAAIELDIAKLKVKRDLALANGQEAEARRISIDISQRELEVQRLVTTSKVQEADLRIAALRAKRDELQATGQLTAELEVELRTRIREAEAQRLQAQAGVELGKIQEREQALLEETGALLQQDSAARGESTKAVSTQTAALERHVTALDRARAAYNQYLKGLSSPLGSIPGLSEDRSNVDAGRIGPDNSRSFSVLTPNNAGPVDNSYSFQVRDRLMAGGTFGPNELAALQAGLAAARNNAILAGESKIPSLTGQRDAEQWVRVFERAIERATSPGLGSGFPQPTPVKPQVTKVVQLDLNVGGRSVPAIVDPLNADMLLAAIESAKASRG